MKKYPLEDVRRFFIQRQFLCDAEYPIPTKDEANQLFARTLSLPAVRVARMRAFIKGWRWAKPDSVSQAEWAQKRGTL
jgi:hypothetical protein